MMKRLFLLVPLSVVLASAAAQRISLPGAAIPASTGTAMRTATKVGTPATGGTMGLSLSELKYRLLDKYPNFFFCDPDFFPLVRRDEQERALARFPEIQKDTELCAAE